MIQGDLDMKLRTLLLLIIMLLAACGAPSAQAPTSAPALATAAPASTVAPAAAPTAALPPAAQPTNAPQATALTVSADSLQVLETTSEYRLIKHARGETKVPLNPSCIVVAGSGYLDHLLTLGVKPCGAAHGGGGSGFPGYLADQLQEVAYVGGTLEVNLESVAARNPDLIIAMHPAHSEGEFKTLFDPIAPTVYLTEPWVDWRTALGEIAMILGKGSTAEAALAEFDAKLAAGRERLREALGSEKVAFLRVLPSELRIYGARSATGALLFDDLGLAPSALSPLDDERASISQELIPQLDADHIFLLDQTEDGMAALKASPLWAKVPAVQQGHVYPVDVKTWVQGEGMIAYNWLIDDVLQALLGSDAVTN
jgi:iron complex transport system substrate-binding protein